MLKCCLTIRDSDGSDFLDIAGCVLRGALWITECCVLHGNCMLLCYAGCGCARVSCAKEQWPCSLRANARHIDVGSAAAAVDFTIVKKSLLRFAYCLSHTQTRAHTQYKYI